MDAAFTSLLLLDALVWVLFLMVRAVKLAPHVMGRYELERRAADGDSMSHKALQREAVLPRLRAVRSLVGFICLIVASLLLASLIGWLLGALVSVLLALQLDAWSTKPALRDKISHFYQRYEMRLVARLERISWIDWFARSERTSEARIHSKPELVRLIERSPEALSRDELKTIKSLLALEGKTVGDIMTPRTVVEAIELNDGVGPLVLDSLHKTGHSRFPVYDGDIDHVVGMLYLHDLVDLKSAHGTVKDAMQSKVHYIHELQDLEHALHGFLRSHHHLFIVVNDYRETVGVLSLEDVIEALLGRQIVDEFDEFHDLRKVAASNPRKNNQPQERVSV